MATAEGLKVAVIIPAYRAADTIEKVLAGIPSWVDVIYVIDDASPDETAAPVGACGDPRVHLLAHRVNLGVGGAMDRLSARPAPGNGHLFQDGRR